VVEPGGTGKADVMAADFLRELLNGLEWDRITRRMHMGLLYGYSVAECMWGRDGGRITLDGLKVRKPWRFGYSPEGALLLRQATSATYTPMPPRKFWLPIWGADDDDTPYGRGLGHSLWWPVFLKRNGAKFWAAYLDRYGVPAAKATYPANATDDEKNKALAAARSLRSEGAVAMPDGFDISLIESTSKGAGDFNAFLNYWDDEIAKIILSQTGTSKIGQYSGTAEVHNQVRLELVKSDGDLLCASFNEGPARWLTEWNWPGAQAPNLWRKVDDGRETAQLDRDTKLYGMGLELKDDAVEGRYGPEWQKSGSGGPSPQAGPPAAFAERGGVDSAAQRDEADDIADQLAELTDKASTAMVDDVRRLMDEVMASGGDLAAFSERLLARYPLAGLDDIARLLTGGLAAARLAGMATADARQDAPGPEGEAGA
jgi:phage gp29-like protein